MGNGLIIIVSYDNVNKMLQGGVMLVYYADIPFCRRGGLGGVHDEPKNVCLGG